MMYHCRHAQYFIISVFIVFITSTSLHAGNFRDFILGGESSTTAQRSVQIPANSKLSACLQCHDGSSAKDVKIKHADTAMSFTSHGSSDHPVGMAYAYYARKSPASYVNPAKLDSRIKLENGQVTCISCHETKHAKSDSTEIASLNNVSETISSCTSKKTFTVGPDRSRLCLACHAM